MALAGVDWNATGAMLSGWATLAGAIAVIYAARLGANTFQAWKRQKVEERRMEAAETILTLAYRLRYDFVSVRGRGIFGYETKAAEDVLDSSMPTWRAQDQASQTRLRTAQTILNRLKDHRSDWDQIWKLKPTALAFFGEEIEAALHSFWSAYVSVEVSASEYGQDDGRDAEFTKKMRSDLWGGEGDTVTPTVEAAISKLESELLPIIRMHQPAATRRENP